jgi:uncharacterized protein (TIGR03083 family)
VSNYEGAYRDVRLRVTDLLRDRPEVEVEQIAPATPEWRIRDVAAHMGGVCDDIANGNMAGVATSAWTKAQVDKRHDWELRRVLDDWEEHAGTVEPMLNDIGQPIGQMVFDAWTHEQDIRGAFGEAGGRDSAALEIAFGWWVEAARAQPLREGAPGALRLVTEQGTVEFGSGEPAFELRTTRFEFLRTLTGRRSREQIRALDYDGPPLEDVLYDNDVFSPARRDIIE